MSTTLIKRVCLMFSALLLFCFIGAGSIFAASVGGRLTAPEAGWKRVVANPQNFFYYNKTWTQIPNFSLYRGVRNSKVVFGFRGSKLRIIAYRYDQRFTDNRVIIDGVTYTYAERGGDQRNTLVFEVEGLSDQEHHVEIIGGINGTGFITVESIDIDSTGEMINYAPTNLNATASNQQVILDWEPNPYADSYTIKYGTEPGKYTDTVSVTKDAYGNYEIPGLASGATYYFVVAGIVNDAETTYSNEASVTLQAAPEAVLNVTIAEDTVKVGDEFIAAISLENVSSIYAEDFRIKYDTERFDYLGFDQVDGYKVYNTPVDENGQIRFIVASQGEEYGITGAEARTFLNLKFKAKSVGTGDVDALYCRIANTETEWDLEDDSCGGDTVTVEQADMLDVNHSGEYTLVDLAIDGFYFGRAAADTDTINHSADQVVDGNVNDDDLVYIVNQMLSNTNYAPNLL
ncbi:cohesin domain-containing protein [Paenibacillus massiliensis]|uniref:cohesin domain-containing protein n=1 Tax=Paenibacillus massiliensis TaxID=225917 RepID=UPI00037C1065|nr:cohesin domain-containing protein [Paenibacillus massiliensis]